MKDENKIWIIAMLLILWLVVCDVLFYGCSTTRYTVDDTDGRNALITIGKLESEIESLDRELERIAEQSSGIESDLSRFGEYLTAYIDTVRSMRRELENYRKQSEANEN